MPSNNDTGQSRFVTAQFGLKLALRVLVFAQHFISSLLFFFLPMGAAYASPCVADLMAQPHIRVGIGVLGRTAAGHLYLGTSPYAGSLHKHIIDVLLERYPIDEILWMGEIRYKTRGTSFKIVEANETSGFYSQGVEEHLEYPVTVSNSVTHIPAKVLAKNCILWEFDPNHQRLISEIEGMADVRHDINNTLAKLHAPISQMFSARTTDDDKVRFLALAQPELKNTVSLMRWLILHLVEEHRLRVARELGAVLRYLSLLSKPTAKPADFARLDRPRLEEELEKLTRLLNPDESDMPVEIRSLN